jgi:hypothetical protein
MDSCHTEGEFPGVNTYVWEVFPEDRCSASSLVDGHWYLSTMATDSVVAAARFISRNTERPFQRERISVVMVIVI